MEYVFQFLSCNCRLIILIHLKNAYVVLFQTFFIKLHIIAEFVFCDNRQIWRKQAVKVT